MEKCFMPTKRLPVAGFGLAANSRAASKRAGVCCLRTNRAVSGGHENAITCGKAERYTKKSVILTSARPTDGLA
jgi:hypothetical protein